MNKTDKRKLLFHLMESLFITFSIMNIGNISTADIMSVCIFGVCFLFLKNEKEPEKTDQRYACIMAAVFTVLLLAGGYTSYSGGLSNKAFIAVYLSATAVGLYFLFAKLLAAFFRAQRQYSVFEDRKAFPGKQFWLFAGLLFLCMIPFLLMNYPGVMTPDSLSQYRQAIETEGYSNHHPWLHTMLFQLLYRIGSGITGNTYSGIAFYTVFQMILMALGESYAIAAMRELGLKKSYCVYLLALFLLYPFHLIYAVTIWKDILFSMSVLILTVTFFRMYASLQTEEKDFSLRDKILFVISGFLMCMFRHNGMYAFMVSLVIMLIVWRKRFRTLLIMGALILGTCFIINGPVMRQAGVKPGEFAYKVCIPLQQIARVITDGGELTEEEETLLSKINDLSYIPEHYQPGGADPMFAWVLYGNQEYLISHKGAFLKLWGSVGLRYPGEYIQAYLDQTRGYWYPMDPEQVVYFGITDNEDGLTAQPVIKGRAAVKCNELLTKLYTMVPIYGICYSMGAAFFVLLLCMIMGIRDKEWQKTVCFLPVFTLMLTVLIAVPLVADLRYGYPMVLTIPFLLVMAWRKPYHLER